MNTSTLQILITATALFAAPATALSEDAIHAPAQKMIGVAKPRIVTSLIVMNARGATLDGGKLTLTGVSPNSIMFADRPVRAAGHALTALLVQEWSGDASFAKDPPNATVSVLSKDGSAVQDAVVVLKSAKLEDDRLTFEVQVLEGASRAPTARLPFSSTRSIRLSCRGFPGARRGPLRTKPRGIGPMGNTRSRRRPANSGRRS